jgi:outer membrane protein OmpA-like peptidoglycan-associated protein
MTHRLRWLLTCLLVSVVVGPGAWAAEGAFVGVDLGVSEPTNGNYRAHVETGGTGNPFVGYMFNDYIGLQGQLHATFQEPDNDHRGFKNENQITTLLGGTLGPRLQIPLGQVMDMYVTGQGGYFEGVSGHLNHGAPGFSVGGGIDYNITPNFAVGVFGRWNRVYMSPRFEGAALIGQIAEERGPADLEYGQGGVSLKYSFAQAAPPPPPPPPPPVAAAPPPPPVKKKIVLRSVHFDFNKSNIRADAVPVLDEAAKILKDEGTIAVIVEGHTDGVGSDAYNLKLSHRRADAVRTYLVGHGVSASRIRTEGYGKRRPVASNDTADGRAQNRRVELRVE